MKTKLYSIFFYCFIAILTFSFTIDEKPKAQPGTYQFIVLNTKMQCLYTEETFIFIEEKRQENEDITIHLNEFTDVFIPSKKTIASPSFQLLPEYFYK